MRVLPSGSTALLVELDDLAEVLALYAALADDVPAASSTSSRPRAPCCWSRTRP